MTALQEDDPPTEIMPDTIVLDPEDLEEPYVLESLCMSCFENGETRMLLTRIPHFKDVMVVSFECSHCGHRNNEIKFTGQFGDSGVTYTLRVPKGDTRALSRQVVKSDSATVKIPDLDFEIPSGTQKGTITTIEGLLSEAATVLRASQEERRAVDSSVAIAVDRFLERLDSCVTAEQEFTVILDDPSGNSHVESPGGDASNDRLLLVSHYKCSKQQQADLGLLAGDEEAQAHPEIAPDDPHHGHAPQGAASMHQALARMQGATADALLSRYSAPEEVMEFPSHCSACAAPCTSRMFNVEIPFFKEVIIMADTCDVCGYKSSEVKGGGGVSEKGRIFTLSVAEAADLQRDVLKSESASVTIPELELEVTTGTLGGLITTVEGLVTSVKEALEQTHSFQLGDSADQLTKASWKGFFDGLDAAIEGKIQWTLILRDPLANSFIAPQTADFEKDPLPPDPLLKMEEYERSEEEDSEFGIDHLKAHGTGLDKQLKELAVVEEEEE